MKELGKPRLAVDLDGVILDFRSHLSEHIEQSYQGKFPPEIFLAAKDTQDVNLKFKELKLKYLNDPFLLKNAPICQGAGLAIAWLADRAIIDINTGRLQGMAEAVSDFLENHGIRKYIDRIQTRSLKLIADAKQLGRIDDQVASKVVNILMSGARFGIDDYLPIVQAYAQRNIFGFLINSNGDQSVNEPMIKQESSLLDLAKEVERCGSLGALAIEHLNRSQPTVIIPHYFLQIA